MPLIASNDEELQTMVLKDMEKVINDFSEYILKQIQNIIQDIVYDPFLGQPLYYERLKWNGGFISAWEKTAAKISSNYVMASVDYTWQNMEYNPEKHQHGDAIGTDRREYLADYIIAGREFDIGGNAQIPRDFWTPIIDMIYDGSLDQILEGLFIKYGIQFQRII